jgi:glycosyltransferase involved in cell wall biosynthesis
MSDVTILIAARNTEATIERAVRSALDQPCHEVVVIDDGSSDHTATCARRAGHRVRVVRPPEHRGLGHARHVGLSGVHTPFCMWLDADDELLPGRVERLIACLDHADAVFDGAELWDGATSTALRTLPMPAFLAGGRAACRLFERNYLPGPAWPALRTEFAKRVGYDASFVTGDDIDFILRGLTAGGRFRFVDAVGYRQHAYPTSLSRNLARQRMFAGRALRRHTFSAVASLYDAAGVDRRVALWGLLSMAVFREEYDTAGHFLDQVSDLGLHQNAVLEPDGPYPVPDAWRERFFRGTLSLLSGRPADAIRPLRAAHALLPRPEVFNNLGLALALTGQRRAANRLFRLALDGFPGYLDARLNLAPSTPPRITTHPLRHHPTRDAYDG